MSILRIRDEDGVVHEVLALRGKDGEDGKDYILTEEDKQDIAAEVPDYVTADSIGAAPAGYGLGDRNVPSTAWKYTKGSGFSRSSNDSPDNTLWWGISSANDSGGGAHIAFSKANDILTEARRVYKTDSYGNVSGDWEYVNPPMNPGVEYRTTDRFNGKAVYKRLTTNDVLEYRLDGEDEWYPYINQIGAAPAGFGLGTTATKITDWNDAIETGFYWNASQTEENPCENAPFPWQAAWGYTIAAINDDAITQVAFTYTGDYKNRPIDGHHQKVRYYKKGLGETPIGWSEWEYVNPQMMPGVEYRTTERFNGKPVYVKYVSTELNLPEGEMTRRSTWVPVSDESVDVIDIRGKLIRNDPASAHHSYFPIPYMYDEKICAYIYSGHLDQTNGKTVINFITTKDLDTVVPGSTYTAHLTVKYTKNETTPATTEV